MYNIIFSFISWQLLKTNQLYLWKLFLFLAVVSLGTTSCSNEDNVNLQNESSSSDFRLKSDDNWPCPPEHRFQIVKEFKLVFLKKFPECEKGFGGCFLRITGTFDCVRINPGPQPPASGQLQAPNSVGEVGVMFQQLDSQYLNMWVPQSIVNSPEHSPSDFDTFEVGQGQYLTDDILLTAGSYPKTIDGTFFKYTIPYTLTR